MNITLWIIQSVVALFFLRAGSMKAFQPMDKLIARIPAMKSLPPALIRFIGVCELAGAAGLILPSVTRILPWMTVAAGSGLVALMGCAAVYHVQRREVPLLPTAILLVALFITVGRWTLAPL